tara:strand:+ start:79 stop:540 length:462 start_codon:yes stop_codon:yes gene_type:complete
MTPKSAWEAIKDYIPKDKVIWEAFYGDGTSGKYLEELGFDVIHRDVNFYEHDLGDIIVTNPPFASIPHILKKIKQKDKPFIMIMPSSKINTQYFRKLFSNVDNPIQIIIPRKRIQFKKMVDGVVDENQKSQCNFDCFYYCYKIGLPRDIVWLE